MDSRLTEVLVCPICKGPLRFNSSKSMLCCAKCAKGFPVIDDIAVMLVKESRDLTPEEVQASRVKPVR